MRILTPQIMNQVFEVIDALEVSREAIQVPLMLEGEGKVQRLKNGKIEITLPDTDDLGPFLATLPDRLRQL
jgi:hypothetical protein